jgi:hypothetical protein
MSQLRKANGRTILWASLLAIVATVVIGAALAMSAGASTGRPRSTSIHVTEVAKNVSAISVSKLNGNTGTGPNQGDYVVLDDPLLKPGTKQVAGHAYTVCYLANVAADINYCNAEFIFPGGHIEAQGSAPQKAHSFTVAITGGTDGYIGARGQATLTPHGNPATATSWDWLITLTS